MTNRGPRAEIVTLIFGYAVPARLAKRDRRNRLYDTRCPNFGLKGVTTLRVEEFWAMVHYN